MTQPRDYGFSEETAMLKESAERFLTEARPVDQLRPHLAGTEDPYRGETRKGWYDADGWQQMVELGWTMLAVPEANGGLGMGLVAAVAIQEEIGRAACPTPLTSTLQATFLARAAGADELLGRIASGEAVALGLFGEAGSLEADSTDVTVANGKLTGTSWFVQDPQKVAAFIVAAKSAEGVGLYLVEASALTVEADRIVDLTRDQGRLVMDGTDAVELAPPGAGEAVIEQALPAILTLLAADMAGAAEWQLMTTAEYAKVRTQFDRPIGFFQAVKHPI
ncbi:MAG: acyl-CoA dehydrogenase family protein, partial [Pseudomonadota bacterium]